MYPQRSLLLLTSTLVLIPGHLAAPQGGAPLETLLTLEQENDDSTSLANELFTDQSTNKQLSHLAAPQKGAPLEYLLTLEQENDDSTSLATELFTDQSTNKQLNLEKGFHNITDEVMFQYLSAQLAKGVDIHSRSKRQFGQFSNSQSDPGTLLRFYARLGDLEQVYLLMEFGGAEVDSEDAGKWTAMMWASRFGHTEVVRYLLEKGAFVNHQNNHGDGSLIWATGAGHADIVELLMIHHADPNLPENINGFSAVSVAAAMNRETELRIMDKHAWIDLDHKDLNNRTPLNLASMVGQPTMVLLLGYHGNVNVFDNAGMSPAHWGVNLRDTSTLRAVLLLCPDLTLQDNRGNTPMAIAKLVGNSKAVQLIHEHLNTPDLGCVIGDDEFPSRDFAFFDCKQMQCMCKGFWRMTGFVDPGCVKVNVNVLAKQEVENSSHGNVTVTPDIFTTEEEEDHHHHEEDLLGAMGINIPPPVDADH